MRYSRSMGMSAPELGWVPSPTYILRRAAILDCLEGFTPGKALEVGCGSGSLLYDLHLLGFHGTGVDLSPEARTLSERILAQAQEISICGDLPAGYEGTFDYLLSFEVLEHIDDDRTALKRWVQFLNDGGHAILSVPAHPRKWNLTDRLVGHYRRYDRADVMELLRAAGLTPIRIFTHGWPATWFIEQVRLFVKTLMWKRTVKDPSALDMSPAELTKRSGIDRDFEGKLFPLYGSFPLRLLIALICRVQRVTYRTDLGISFIVVARRNGSGKRPTTNYAPSWLPIPDE